MGSQEWGGQCRRVENGGALTRDKENGLREWSTREIIREDSVSVKLKGCKVRASLFFVPPALPHSTPGLSKSRPAPLCTNYSRCCASHFKPQQSPQTAVTNLRLELLELGILLSLVLLDLLGCLGTCVLELLDAVCG